VALLQKKDLQLEASSASSPLCTQNGYSGYKRICENSTSHEPRVTNHESRIGAHCIVTLVDILKQFAHRQVYYTQWLCTRFVRNPRITSHESRVTNQSPSSLFSTSVDILKSPLTTKCATQCVLQCLAVCCSQKSAHYQMCYPKYL